MLNVLESTIVRVVLANEYNWSSLTVTVLTRVGILFMNCKFCKQNGKFRIHYTFM